MSQINKTPDAHPGGPGKSAPMPEVTKQNVKKRRPPMPLPVPAISDRTVGHANSTPSRVERHAPISLSGSAIANRTINLGITKSEKEILNDFIQLEKSSISLVDASLKEDNAQTNEVLSEIKTLSQKPLPDVRIGVAAAISEVSRVEEVWDEPQIQNTCLSIWDGLIHNMDAKVSNTVRGIMANGLGPPSICPQEIAKEFSTYSKLNYFANHGIVEVSGKPSKDPNNDLYQLPSGYKIAQFSDLPKGISLRDPNSKLEKSGGFIYNPKTGLIKTAEGLKAMLFIGPDGKAVLSFAGTEGGWRKGGSRFTSTMISNFHQNIMGGVPRTYNQARDLVDILRATHPKLVLTGFSQGGALAQFVGVYETLPTYTMNAAGLEIGILKSLAENDPSAFGKASQHVHNLHLEGELVYSLLDSGLGGVLLGQLLQVPVSEAQESLGAGKRHSIKSVYSSLQSFIKPESTSLNT